MTAWSENLPGWLKRKQKEVDEADQRSQTKSGSVELTGGGGSGNDPVVVWNAPHRLEAEVVKAHLESEGIPAFIRGEAYGMITGITVGHLAQAQVLVPGLLADKALEILAADVEVEAAEEEPGSGAGGASEAGAATDAEDAHGDQAAGDAQQE